MYYLFFSLQILLSAFIGGLIGWQREHVGKEAGLRTHALVAIGATLFTLLSLHAFPGADTARVAAQIVTGIGFIGAGSILHKRDKIEGLTTAAALWAVAAIGMAIGAGRIYEASIAGLIIFVLLLLRHR